MSPQTCTNCGSELVSGQRFCPACGTPVAAARTEAVAAPPPKKAPRHGLRLLLAGGGGLVLLACICIAVFVVGALLLDTGVAPLTTSRQDYEATGVAPLATPRLDYEAGEFFIELIEQTDRGRREIYHHQTFSDFAAEVQVRFETDVESVRGGLVWRYQDEPSYYYFNIRNSGRYALEKFSDGEWHTLVPATASPYINTGIATNNLEVVASDDLIRMFVNDQYLEDFIDSSLSEGKIGLRGEVVAESPITTRVFFDNLRVYEWTEASTVLFEDDFDDPESGWAATETEVYRVGYVSASEAIEASGPVEVVSERELTPEEFFWAVEGDERFAEVLVLAAEEGYTDAETGVEAVMSDGSVLAVLPLSSPEGETIGAFRLQGDERSNSLLARLEDETVILYDGEGRAEITEQGVRVFDADGNVIGDMELQGSSRPSGLSAPQQQFCAGGAWDDFNHCVSPILQRGDAAALACGTLIASCWVPGIGFPACLVGIVPVCPYVGYCAYEMSSDDPPTVAINTMPVELDTPCEIKCVTTLDGRQGVLTVRKWRFQVDVDDDRAPRPQTPRSVEVCSGSGKWLEPEVQDCYGHEVPFYVEGPDQVLWGEQDLKVCLEGQVCPEGESECSYREALAPAILRFEADAESIQDGDCTDLRWEVDAVEVRLDRAIVPAFGSIEVCPTQTTAYRLYGYGSAGDFDSRTVVVEVTAGPSIDFYANEESIQGGDCTYLNWEVMGATEVLLDGDPVSDIGNRPVCPAQTTTYVLRAEGPGGGWDTRTVEVEVTAAETTGKPVITIWLGGSKRDWHVVPSVSPCFIVKWDVQNATTVYLDGEHVGATDQRTLCATAPETTYTFIAEGPGGRDEKSFTVTVSTG